MIHKRPFTSALVVAILALFQTAGLAQANQMNPVKTGYAPVDRAQTLLRDLRLRETSDLTAWRRRIA